LGDAKTWLFIPHFSKEERKISFVNFRVYNMPGGLKNKTGKEN
jgi:hypothetical protein